MTRVLIPLIYSFLCLVTLCCRGDKINYATPADYDLNKPIQVKLPLELDEISGLSYYSKDTSVFAISDEKGWLYKIKLGGEHEIDRWKFSAKADFEDLVLLDSIFYILQSNGIIHKVTFEPPNNDIHTEEFELPYAGKDEFETLYYDDAKKKLILVCKDCESDKKKSLTTCRFDPVTDQFSDSSFVINVKDIAKSQDEVKIRFKPSAAAINPADNMLYIISSVNKLLVITDRNGQFKSAYPLNPSLFKQPEGIAFTPAGSMIISNESADVGVADILIFPNHKSHP